MAAQIAAITSVPDVIKFAKATPNKLRYASPGNGGIPTKAMELVAASKMKKAQQAAAQIVSYEIAMGFALVGVLMAAQNLNLGAIVGRQLGHYGLFNWFFIPLFPLFLVYLIAGVAETNRAPFDVAEGE